MIKNRGYLLQIQRVDGIHHVVQLARGAVVVEHHAVAQSLHHGDGVARVLVLVVDASVVEARHVALAQVAVIVAGAGELLGVSVMGKGRQREGNLEILAHRRDAVHEINGTRVLHVVGARQEDVVLLEDGVGLHNVIGAGASLVGLMGTTAADNLVHATRALLASEVVVHLLRGHEAEETRNLPI
jgi:hypothetical protein